MSSSITNNFKQQLLRDFKADIDSSGNTYYIALARSESLVEPSIISSEAFAAKLRHRIQSVKVASNNSFVVPNVPWVGSTTYNAYDDNLPDQENFYVVNSSNEVFICVEQGTDEVGTPVPSTLEPTAAQANNQAKTFKTNDGYLWRYLYTLSNLAYALYRTADWIPVQRVTNRTTLIPEEARQVLLQDSAVAGEIIGLAIDSAGYNYTGPVINITSETGAGASFKAKIDDGRITAVYLDSNGDGLLAHGQGYDYNTTVTVSDPGTGVGASLRPILGPKDGIAYDPVATLKCDAIMLQTDFINDEDNTIQAQNQFYQVALMQNIKGYNDSDFTANTGNALRRVELTGISGTWAENDTFEDVFSLKAGKIFYVDGSTLYYVQDETTGFTELAPGDELVTEQSGTATVVSLSEPDIDIYSGNILYINNLDAEVTREANQTEDIRIVVQLG
jgi:hypothetical protein